MIYEGRQNSFQVTKGGEFAVDRGAMYNLKSARHEGTDYYGKKDSDIKAELSGVVSSSGFHKSYGNMIIVKTDLVKYFSHAFDKSVISGKIYQMYCHLFEIKKGFGKFVKYGEVIGSMGNSGNCLTRDNGMWRQITEKEQNNPKFIKGTHLHFGFSTSDEQMVKYIYDKAKDKIKTIPYIFQWSRYYLNPDLVFEFLDRYKDG